MLHPFPITDRVSPNQGEFNMARYTGPKNKLSRREGVDLMGKGVKLKKLNIPPGVHGPKAKGKKLSNYGTQLREKQKVKRTYGLLERQFSNYVQGALNSSGNTTEALLRGLERRLDNVLFRSGIVPTRNMARQLVVHGHVNVAGKKVDRPSYAVRPGEIVSLSEKAVKMPVIVKQVEQGNETQGTWLKRKTAVTEVVSLPTLEDVTEPLSWNSVIEYYSR